VRRAGPAGGGVLLRLAHDNPFEYDVQRRALGTAEAENVLGSEAATTLDEMLDDVIAWIGEAIKNGTI
jgi:UDP-glucose 4-epimerase